MPVLETFTLKGAELKHVEQYAPTNPFLANVLTAQHDRGAITAKMRDAVRDSMTHLLKGAELRYVEERAPNDPFFANVLSMNACANVSKKMHDAVKTSLADWQKRPIIGGVRISNRIFRDGKPICKHCANDRDAKFATKTHGDEGLCETHYAVANGTTPAAVAADGVPA